jgi:hypothetical protein
MLLFAEAPIPSPDRFGLPGHWAIFLVLYHITLVVHLLFMNFAFGGVVVTLVNDVRALFSRKAGYLTDLNRRVFKIVSVVVSFTITFAVAPLLFIQTLYGPIFYTATILIGLPWMAVIAVLIAGFYLVYVVRFTPAMPGSDRPEPVLRRLLRIVVCLLVIAAFASIAMMLTSEAVWSINPQAWQARHDSPSLAFLPPDAQFWPRYAHNLNGGLAMACLLLAGMAQVLARRGSVDRDWLRRTARGFLLAAFILTAVQIAAGIVLLLHLRGDARDAMLFSYEDANIWGWRVGLAAAIFGCVFMIRGIRQPGRPLWTWIALTLMVVTVAGMSLARQAVRSLYLGDAFSLSRWGSMIHPQWAAMAMFLVSFLVALAMVAWMLWQAWKIREPAPAAVPTSPADKNS